MSSSFQLPKNHEKTSAGIIRFFNFSICLVVLLLLYFLYFTDRMSNGPVLFSKQVHRPPLSVFSRRLQDFRHEWLRQRRTRVDWKNIIKPCADNMAWGIVKEHWGETNRSNATTSDIIFKDVRPAGEFSKIFIQSKTSDNRTKSIGGDTWRVYVRGPTSIAATVFDHNNGTYEALFLITEPGVYQLMIYLDYSLCDGLKDPPRDWFIIGDHREGILGPLDEYLVKQQFSNGQSALTINVTKSQLKVPICEFYKWTMPQDYSQSGTLWIYGDSLGYRLYTSVKTRPLCKLLYKECDNSYMGIDRAHKGFNIKLERDLHFSPELVIETVVNVLRSPELQQEESALLLNLVVHYAKKINFTTYKSLIDDLILAMKASELSNGERVPKYKAKIIWKSSTAICKEKATSSKETNYRFYTSQRVALFHAYSMSAMCKAGFDVIDVYSLTDSYPHRCIDHVHYTNKVFNMVETMLEQYKVHYNKKLDENEKHGKIKRCISTENF